MPDSVLVQVTGLAELGRALNSIPAILATRVMRGALHAAGDVFGAAIEATEPVRTGALKEDEMVVAVHVSGDLTNNWMQIGPGYDRGKLTVRGVKRNKRGDLEAIVDTTESPGVYDLFVEMGHKAPGRGVRNQLRRRAHDVEFGGRSTPAHPFMRPAFEASKQEALETFVVYVRGGLDAVIREASRS